MAVRHQLSVNSSAQLVKRSVLVVTAGQSRSGKSTALNNIFGTDFKSKYSPTSVTRSVDVRCVDGHEDELIVVDTPGLASRDIKTARVKKELDRAIGGLKFVLIYCHSVSPNSSIDEAEENVVKNLQKVLGKDIWKKCVLLFTFSDTLRHEECPKEKDRDKYKECLESHAKTFSELLRECCGSDAPEVKVISVVKPRPVAVQEGEGTQQEIWELLAVPVGKHLSVGREEHLLVTGIKLNWRALAARMIIEKAHDMDRDVYKTFIRDKISFSTPLAGIILGATLGGAGGATVGLAIGGFGAFPGAAIGAGAGAVTGLLLGGLAGTSAALLDKKSKAKKGIDKLNKLKSANRVHRQSAPLLLDSSLGDWYDAKTPEGRPRGISVPVIVTPHPSPSPDSMTASVSSGFQLPAPVPTDTVRSPESPSPEQSLGSLPSTQRAMSRETITPSIKAEDPEGHPEDPVP